MAGGWSRDGAVQEQIDASVADAVKQARNRLPKGESASHCNECEKEIPQARRDAVPGVRLCVACQSEIDEDEKAAAIFNRRGGGGSQLR